MVAEFNERGKSRRSFQDAARKIKEEEDVLGSGIVTNKSTHGFDPASPNKDDDQHPYIEDIFAVDLSITDFPFRKDERTLFNKRNSRYGVPPSPAPIPDNLFDFIKNSMQSNSIYRKKHLCYLESIWMSQIFVSVKAGVP